MTSAFDTPPPSPVLRTLRRVARVAPPYVDGLLRTVLLAVAGSAALLAGPLVVQRLVDGELVGTASVDVGRVVWTGVIALVAGIAGAAANRRAVERMLTATAEGTAHLRVATLDHLHGLRLQDLQSERRGALVSRVTGDLDVVTDFMGWGGVGFLVGAVRVLAALVGVAVVEWRIAVAILPLLVAYALALRASQRVLERAHDRVRDRVGDSLGAVGEVVAGLPTLRVHGAEAQAVARVDEAVERQFRAEFRVGTLGAALFSSAEVFAAALTIVAVTVGVLVGGVTVGQLVACLFLVALLIDPVQTMVETIHEAQAAMAGLRRVLHVLDEPRADGARRGRALPPGPLGVEVRDLHHAYDDGPPVLRGVSVTVAPRSHVAVVGETGSGKTTLVRLLGRLLEPLPGTVLLGDVPLDEVDTDDLRRRVAHVPQEVFLFDTTLRDNLRYGAPDADDATLRRVLADLDLADWLAGLSEGLDTEVGERGGRLSAGERQLVALARAALADPDLLLLDEATSAVDPDLDVRLRHAIELLGAQRTTITVAHRLSTAEAADLVLVMDRGRLVEQGTHAWLVAQGGTYAALHADWVAGTATT